MMVTPPRTVRSCFVTLQLLLCLALVSGSSYAQSSGELPPLPAKFTGIGIMPLIYNTPNPNRPAFTSVDSTQIVWAHSTVIKAPVQMEILEAGAWLLYNGAWRFRASFRGKKLKKLFQTKSLALQAGDSLVFEQNNRYDRYTQSGWNFWYVLAKVNGQQVMGYELLHTTGEMQDGTAVLAPQQEHFDVWWNTAAETSLTQVIAVDQAYPNRLITQSGLPALTQMQVLLPFDAAGKKLAPLTIRIPIRLSPKGATATQATLQWQGKVYRCPVTLQWTAQEEQQLLEGVLELSSLQLTESQIPPQLHFRLGFQKDYPGSNPYNRLVLR